MSTHPPTDPDPVNSSSPDDGQDLDPDSGSDDDAATDTDSDDSSQNDTDADGESSDSSDDSNDGDDSADNDSTGDDDSDGEDSNGDATDDTADQSDSDSGTDSDTSVDATSTSDSEGDTDPRTDSGSDADSQQDARALALAGNDADDNLGDSSTDASCSSCHADKAKTGTSTKIQKTVTANIVTLAFRLDHLDASGNKLIKPSPGDYKDATAGAVFKKPEWDVGKGDPYEVETPVSYTKATNVQVDIEIDFTVTPAGQTASITKVRGTAGSGFDYFSFEKQLVPAQTVGTHRIPVTGLVSKDKLPNFVTLIKRGISWFATIDGTEQSIGTTSHRVYVTFNQPIGKMASTTPNLFTEAGPDQDATEERLAFAVDAAQNTGLTDEKECVDAIFVKLCKLNVGYYLGRNWVPGYVNTTGMVPKPTLHHYLWKTMADSQNTKGECHNIAAGFELVCRMVGVSGPFEVGYMLPRPSRAEQAPTYPRIPNALLGMYNTNGSPYWRQHAGENHGWEQIWFLDGQHQTNNFEGVARYRNALYALGDAVFDLFNDPQQNASSYFAKRSTDPNYKVINLVITQGIFELVFNRYQGGGCVKPYPWMNNQRTYRQGLNLPPAQQWDLTATVFHWHD